MKYAAITAAALMALACGPARQAAPTETSDQPKPGGTLTVKMPTDMFDFDTTYVGQSTPNSWAGGWAHIHLLDFETGPKVGYADAILKPELAERWEVSPDARTFTFHIRKGVKFADKAPVNGREITASDVKWSFEYISRTGELADKKLPKSQGDWMFTGLEAIETPTPNTVVVRYKQPFAPFLYYAASERLNPIYPKEQFEQDGHFKNRVLGAGAFVHDAAATQKGNRWVFKKNQSYFEAGKPYLDEVRGLVLSDDATALAAFQTKQLDVMEAEITIQGADDLIKARPDGVMYRFPSPTPMQLFWNTQRPPITDERVRKAIALAVDRDEFIKAFTNGQGTWAISGALDGIFTQEELRSLQKFDPERAKQLVREAGYPDGLTLEMNYPGKAYGDQFISEMELLQAQLRKVGINLTFKSQDKEAFSASKKTGEYVINLTRSANLEGDIADWVFSMYHQDSRQNNYHVKDPELTKRLEAMQGIADPAKRKEEVRAISRYVYDKSWGLSIYHGIEHFFWAPGLKNFAPHFWKKGAPVINAWLDR